MRLWSVIALAILAVAAIAGCSRNLVLAPAPAAVSAPGSGRGAVAHEDGVDVEAYMQAWAGRPADLSECLTPVLVKIDNHGTRALRIRDEDFTLVSASGRRHAIPVGRVHGSLVRPSRRMLEPGHAFYVAPYLSGHYPWLPPDGGPFVSDPFDYDTYTPRPRRIQLPTLDMAMMALPQGLVDRGGRVGGFLYFRPLDHDVKHAALHARLVTAGHGEEIGTVTIPLVAAG